MRRQLAAACALAVAFVAGVLAPVSFAEGEPTPTPTTTATAQADIGAYLLAEIAKWRRETWKWERLMRVRRTPARRLAERSNDSEERLLYLNQWRRKAKLRRRQAYNPPLQRAWLCIQRHEGPWNDPHPPYYGGLQMDLSFQRTYGRELLRAKGTANRWTPIEQMWVAVRAFRSGRGFYPWPNTARYCGLL